MGFFFQRYLSDLNSYIDLVHSWDLDFRQLDCGDFKGSLLQYGYDDVQIGITTISRKFDQRGSAPEKSITFCMLNPESPPIIWRGVEVDHQKVMIYCPGDEIDCASEPGFSVAGYSISDNLLSKLGRDMGMHRPEEALSRNKVLPISTRSQKMLLSVFAETTRKVGPGGVGINTEPVRCALEVTIPRLILSATAATQDIKISSPLTNRRLRALAAIEQRLAMPTSPPTTVGELCQVAGVSERTLQYLLKQKYGITPKAYLKLVRLNGVHRALYRTNSRKAKIADIANEWGFWHMGQFAKDYKGLFGELPSVTFSKRLTRGAIT
jgi:AraC family ethanolamine operon transcriptional activator